MVSTPKPHIPVGGRLCHFLEEWKAITSDQWVLEVIEHGYSLEFMQQPPPPTGVRPTRLPSEQQKEIVLKEVATLLEKNAIEPVPPSEVREGFYSTIFCIPKKDPNKLRPCINLKPLNKYLAKKSFKIEHLAKVIGQLRQGDWAMSIDLADAYFHIAIRAPHRKYLRFCVDGKCWQFRALPFGPTVAPRVWAKVLAAAIQHLRELGVAITSYFDDSLLYCRMPAQLRQNRQICLTVLTRLGLLVSWDKSELEETQSIIFIGGHFRLDEGLVGLPLERFQKLKEIILEMTQRPVATAQHFLRVLGMMAATIQVVRMGRLRMRPIQLHLLHFWKPSSREYNAMIPVNRFIIEHLLWWTKPVNIFQGIPLTQSQPQVEMETDSSSEKWGGLCQGKYVQGVWSLEEQKLHINVLEMRAVILVVAHFHTQLKDSHLLVRSDNMSVVCYIQKMGGTKSPQLCMETWKLFKLIESLNMKISSSHLSGVLNSQADFLSRHKVQETEWCLHQGVLEKVFMILDRPHIDLFASDLTHQLPTFCSWKTSEKALQIDAFTLSWAGIFCYAYPPIFLIPRIIQKLDSEEATMILVAPWWPRRSWFTQILERLVAVPVILPQRQDLLRQPVGQFFHPDPAWFKLVAWKISGSSGMQEAFRNALTSCAAGQSETRLDETMTISGPSTPIGVLHGVSLPGIVL